MKPSRPLSVGDPLAGCLPDWLSRALQVSTLSVRSIRIQVRENSNVWSWGIQTFGQNRRLRVTESVPSLSGDGSICAPVLPTHAVIVLLILELVARSIPSRGWY